MQFAIEAGTAAQWLTFAAFVFGLWVIYKGGGGSAVGVLRDANEVLEKRVGELETLRASDAALIAELRGRTDVTLALAPLSMATEAHEARAQARFEKSMVVLELIAERLGPDNGNGAE